MSYHCLNKHTNNMNPKKLTRLELSEALCALYDVIGTLENTFLHVPQEIWKTELNALRLKYEKLCAEANRRDDEF